MASKARFGRLPRSSPSLTATIVALAQEYQRVRESNMVDAWKSGGEFEGKKVTDDMLMKWMKDRRNELSPGDPKWDYYNNQLIQYEFAIENSKMELKYKQGDVTDMGMVAFYHKWSAKLPKDSEAYREREKLAAAYADRAKSGSAGRGRARSDAAYNNKIAAAYKKEFTYDTMLFFLETEAHNRGILKGNETLADVDPSAGEGHDINTLWDEIANAPEYADERLHYTQQIKDNGNRNFNGDFSQDAFNGEKRTKMSAVNGRIQDARAAGRKEDATRYEKDKEGVKNANIITSGFDETELYEDARADWIAVFENPNATPLEIDRATTKYKADLTKIKAGLEQGIRPGQFDDRIGWVDNELQTLDGDLDPLEHWGGAVGPGANTGQTEATKTATGIRQNQQDMTNLSLRDAYGQPLFFLMKTADGKAAATTPGNHGATAWGVVPRDAVDPNAVYVIQNEPGDSRSSLVVTAVMPTPVYIVSDVRADDGTVGPKRADTPSAYNYTMPDGKTGYKYKDGAGVWQYTPDNPFGTFGTLPDGTPGIVPRTVSLDSDGGTVMVPGNGVAPAGTSTAILPSYYNPGANVAMTSRLAKSGYGMWLIASDPKDRAAYALKPDDIIKTIQLETGTDVAALRVAVADADAHRGIYLGTSTEEQNRVRANAYSGTPNPVSLAEVMTKVGVTTPSAEQRRLDELLIGTPGGQRDIEAERGRMTLPGVVGQTPTLSLDETVRKYNMVAVPPSPIGEMKVAPTSLGAGIPNDIAGSLVAIIQSLTGPKSVSATSVLGRPTGPTGPTTPSYVPDAMKPPDATPPPPKPAPPPPRPTVAPAPTTSYGPRPVAPPDINSPRNRERGQTQYT